MFAIKCKCYALLRLCSPFPEEIPCNLKCLSWRGRLAADLGLGCPCLWCLRLGSCAVHELPAPFSAPSTALCTGLSRHEMHCSQDYLFWHQPFIPVFFPGILPCPIICSKFKISFMQWEAGRSCWNKLCCLCKWKEEQVWIQLNISQYFHIEIFIFFV